ncbi:MAG: NYN domain-containing protein [Alphaproteobacteria bacterium]|nr:NYN domain-containing protein [Alphaproteobacteria bacterium]
MKTIIYVDALNFYYGSLKHKRGERYKWLDLAQLFQILLPGHQIVRINYFTAIVKSEDGSRRQRTYIRALKAHHPEMIKVHYGRFSQERVLMKNASPPPQKCEVLRNKEKRTDVNLAARLLEDAWTLSHDEYDCAVVVSNDTDLSGAMEVFKRRFPERQLWLISPRRRVSGDLREQVDSRFIRKIRRQMLKNSQLPNPIPGTNIYKPNTW